MATDVDIANRALSRLGAARIDALTSDTKNARAANSALAIVREEVLADHPWNCAVKRAYAYARSFAISAITLTGTRVRITIPSGHGLADRDPVDITGVVGTTEANGSWLVGNVGATTFDLVDPNTNAFEDDDGYSAYTSGGTVTLRGLTQFRFQYPLPSDCLRVLEIDGQRDATWQVENGKLLTDLSSPIALRYIYRNTNTATYPPILVSALAARLAAELALEVVDSPDKRNLAMSDYASILSRAKGADAREQTPAELDESPWITVRLTS